jgi:ubiquinone/menaquinone biosynthesis C-methylase UbiE
MRKRISRYNQYKNDIFNKLDFDFERNKKILDVGCGDGSDLEIFANEFDLNVFGIDIYRHGNIKPGRFMLADILNLPFKDRVFDYVFLHDVLHHIDETNQNNLLHIQALKELTRVCSPEGYIIIVEANRYNPLLYPHMVKLQGHNHWRQSYFIKIINAIFKNPEFKFFEAHFYPWFLKHIFKIYEFLMENFSPKCLLAYNVAIIKNEKDK